MPRRVQPVGDILVSYSADRLPTDTLAGLHDEIRSDHDTGARDARQTVRVLDWLLRIAIQKLRALEAR